MRVRLKRDGIRRNPDFDRRRPRDRKTNWPTRTVPVGTEIEHPDAWMLCLPTRFDDDPLAEPVDDEARTKVEQALAQRAQAIADRERRRQEEENLSRRRKGKQSDAL